MATILIVDDEARLRESLVAAFRKSGYTFEQASDGQAALDLIAEKGPPNLVITDVEMIPMDGISLTLALPEELPVIIVTGGIQDAATRQTCESLIKSGRVHILEKPYEVDELRALIAEKLSKS